MRTAVVLVGTRPEAIKLAPVIRALRDAPDLEAVVVSTGQHKEMLQQVFALFGIRPDRELDVMRAEQTLAGLTARLVEAVDGVLGELEPDLCVVQGDTTTAMVGALAAFYRRVPSAHVEAGLRTGDLAAPFPEEANRRLISCVATLHFPPTEVARQNLIREGVAPERAWVTGNTVIDALHMELASQAADGRGEAIRAALADPLGPGWWERPYVLVTGHRRENFGAGFREICHALLELARMHPDTGFVYPVHLNPNVQRPVRELLGSAPTIRLIPPQDYSAFVALMQAARLVLTDSGGIQEEAPGLGKPVLVMRATTERPEGVAAGTVRLVGTDRRRIVDSVHELLTDPRAHAAMAGAVNPYGDGHASERILGHVRAFLAEG
jgi:UDP-N-acetylglucosamine 2-epimerase (non-hydrolysing)